MTIDLILFYKFFLILTRASIMLFFVPVIGSRTTPSIAKVGISLMLSIIMLDVVNLNTIHIPDSFMQLFIDVIREMLIGITIGFAARLVFEGIQFGGQYVGYMMGFAIVNVIDPQSETHLPIISQLENLLAILVFLSIGGHLWFISAFSDSFQILPLGGAYIKAPLIKFILKAFGEIFIIAIKINAPIFLTLFLIQLVLAIMARVVPQMNIFMVGLPLQISIGFLVLFVSLRGMVYLFGELFYKLKTEIYLILKMLSG